MPSQSPISRSVGVVNMSAEIDINFSRATFTSSTGTTQPRSQGLSSSLPWSGRKKEGYKRDPGNEVGDHSGSKVALKGYSLLCMIYIGDISIREMFLKSFFFFLVALWPW